MEIIKKIEELQTTIKRHEYNLLVLDEKTISDAEMKVLKEELYFLKQQVKNKETQESHSEMGQTVRSKVTTFKFFDNFFDEN